MKALISQSTAEDLSTQALDWTPVRETIRMLYLSITQIEIALHESDTSVEQLTHAFTSMLNRENEITSSLEQLLDGAIDPDLQRLIKKNAAAAAEKMNDAIVAFQFYDRLTQRLEHVCSSMETLSELLGDDDKLGQQSEWQLLQDDIKSKFSMREEYELFDAVMAGGDIRKSIQQFHEFSHSPSNDDVDFF